MTRSALLLPAVLAATFAACASGPTPAEILELQRSEMSQALAMPVGSLDALDPYIKVLVRRNIAGHSALGESDLWNLELYSAGLRGPAGEYIPSKVLRLPFRDSAGGGGLYLSFDSQGMLQHLGTSNPRLNDSDAAIWASFFSQFHGRRAAQPAELMTPGRAQIMFANADGAMLDHYRIQRSVAEHRARMRRHEQEINSGQLPNAADLQRSAQAIADWPNWIPASRSTLGEATTRALLDYASQTEQLLSRAAEASRAQEVAELRDLLSVDWPRAAAKLDDLRSARSFEVADTSHELRRTWLGVPILDRVDKDTWSPADREVDAQQFASMVHAGLLLAGHLKSEARL